jgi:hypothetical protein
MLAHYLMNVISEKGWNIGWEIICGKSNSYVWLRIKIDGLQTLDVNKETV